MPQTRCIELWKLKMWKKTWLYTQNCQDSCQQHSNTSHHPWQNGWHLEVWLTLAVPVELCETVEGNQVGPRPQLPHSLLSKKLPMKIYIHLSGKRGKHDQGTHVLQGCVPKQVHVHSIPAIRVSTVVSTHYCLFQPPILYSDWNKAYISCLELMMAMFDTVIFHFLTWRAKVWCKELPLGVKPDHVTCKASVAMACQRSILHVQNNSAPNQMPNQMRRSIWYHPFWHAYLSGSSFQRNWSHTGLCFLSSTLTTGPHTHSVLSYGPIFLQVARLKCEVEGGLVHMPHNEWKSSTTRPVQDTEPEAGKVWLCQIGTQVRCHGVKSHHLT